MYYRLKKSYTHHGGSEVKLVNLPEGTLLFKNPRGMGDRFYETVAESEDFTGFFINAEIVENYPEFFEKIEKEEWEKIILLNEVKSFIETVKSKGVNYEELIGIVEKTFGRFNLPNPFSYKPYEPIIVPYERPHSICGCGNDGTKPCWSTACPNRMIITYGTCSNPTWITNTTIDSKKDENK